MYIIGKVKADCQGRINVSNLFKGQTPKQVVLVVDVEQEQILILNTDEKCDFGAIQTIDEKNRLILPKWILEEVGNYREFFLVVENGKKYISPKTGDILPKQS